MKEISLTGSLLFLYICYTILKDLFASSTVKEEVSEIRNNTTMWVV